MFYCEWCVQQYVLWENVHGVHSGKEGQGKQGNGMGWRALLEAVILEKIWMIITSSAILRLKT